MNINQKLLKKPQLLLFSLILLTGILAIGGYWSFRHRIVRNETLQPLASPNSALLASNQFTHPCQHLECLNFAEKSEYSLTEVYRSTTDTLFAYYKSTESAQEIRLEVMATTSKETSLELLQKRLARIEGIFQKDISPYPGEISDSVVCGDKFQPEISVTPTEAGVYATVSTYLNDRKVLGVCTDDQKAFHLTMYLLACPSNVIVAEVIQEMSYSGKPKLTHLSCN